MKLPKSYRSPGTSPSKFLAFFICERAWISPSGKFSYTDAVDSIQAASLPFAPEAFVFAMMVSGLSGKHKFDIRVIDPKGVAYRIAGVEHPCTAGAMPTRVYIRVDNSLIFRHFGLFRFQFLLDGIFVSECPLRVDVVTTAVAALEPGVPDDVEAARCRLRRAWLHINEFNDEVYRFKQSNTYQVIEKQEIEGGQTFKTFTFKVARKIPTDLSITFGEAVHQLRSACDNLVMALGKVYFPGEKKLGSLGFPIKRLELPPGGGGKDDFTSWSTRYPFPPNILAFFRAMQPFDGYTHSDGRVFPDDVHPLVVLDHLWIRDKHETPIKVAAVHTGSNVEVPGMRASSAGNSLSGGSWIVHADGTKEATAYASLAGGVVIEDGAEYAKVFIPPGHPIDDVKAPIAIEVTTDERSIAGVPAHDLLIHLHEFVRNEIVAKMEPFF